MLHETSTAETPDASPKEKISVAIVGSRNYPNLEAVSDFVSALPEGTVIISGGAYGVDSIAAAAARRAGLEVAEFLPDWNKHGKCAGFVRNCKMVNAADVIVASWDGKSRGTTQSIELGRKANKPVFVVPVITGLSFGVMLPIFAAAVVEVASGVEVGE